MNEEELRHYGILGMKWGMRRAAKRGEVFDGKSKRTRKLEDKVKNESMRIRNIKNPSQRMLYKLGKYRGDLEMSKVRDAARLEYAKKTSAGKYLLQTLTMGPIGGTVYRRLRAVGYKRSIAAQSAIVSYYPVIGLLSAIDKERYAVRKHTENMLINREINKEMNRRIKKGIKKATHKKV